MPPRRGRPTRVNRVEDDVEPPPPQGTINATEVANIVALAINAAMTAMAQQFPQARQPVAPVAQAHTGPSAWERVRESFLKGHPPEFQGGADVIMANQWKKDMQRHL